LHEFRSSDERFGGDGAVVRAGQILTFEFESWSRYDGATFYLFRDASGGICIWSLGDDDEIDGWRGSFEEQPKDRP